jgi:hypothetical protein
MKGLRKKLLVYGAPVLLCVIAGTQIYFARTTLLSPWKGGGFGMFSTVDSPAARFLRIFLITKNEEIPILLPPDMNTTAQQVRTIPTEAGLRNIARYVSRGQWVAYQMDSAVDHYRDLLSKYSAADGDLTRHDQIPDRNAVTAADRKVIDFGEARILRRLQVGESVSPHNPPIEFTKVRAELWMIKFDAQTSQLRAARVFEITVDRKGQ